MKKDIKRQLPKKIILQLAQLSQVNEVHSLYKIQDSFTKKQRNKISHKKIYGKGFDTLLLDEFDCITRVGQKELQANLHKIIMANSNVQNVLSNPVYGLINSSIEFRCRIKGLNLPPYYHWKLKKPTHNKYSAE